MRKTTNMFGFRKKKLDKPSTSARLYPCCSTPYIRCQGSDRVHCGHCTNCGRSNIPLCDVFDALLLELQDLLGKERPQ